MSAAGAHSSIRLIDSFIANDEISFVRYRLHAHENITYRVLICEANVSITRSPKPWHVTDALTAEEIRRFNIRLVHIPFTLHRNVMSGRPFARYAPVDGVEQALGASSLLAASYHPSAARYGLPPSPRRTLLQANLERHVESAADDKEINNGMRFGLSIAIAEELEALPMAARSAEATADVFVHVSDLDEILDVDAVRAGVAGTAAAVERPSHPRPHQHHRGDSIERVYSSSQPAHALGSTLPPSSSTAPPSPPPFSCMSPRLRYHFYGPFCAKVRLTCVCTFLVVRQSNHPAARLLLD